MRGYAREYLQSQCVDSGLGKKRSEDLGVRSSRGQENGRGIGSGLSSWSQDSRGNCNDRGD